MTQCPTPVLSTLSIDATHIPCPLKEAYSLWLFPDKHYNTINAYNLGVLARLSYAKVKGEKEFVDLTPGGADWFQKQMELKQPPFKAKATTVFPLMKTVNKGSEMRDLEMFYHATSSTEAIWMHDDDSLVISVRGTQELVRDIGIDLAGLQTDFKIKGVGKGQVHQGFLWQAQAIIESDQLDKYLGKYKNGKQIYITGHSLGAAVATILAAYIKEAYGLSPILYTYGSPRTGDEVFAKAYNSITHFRHVNQGDPIPSVPGRWVDVGFDFKPTDLLLPGPGGVVRGFNMRGPGFYHHGTLCQITTLGRATLIAPFSSHKITAQGVQQVVDAQKNLNAQITNAQKRYEQAYMEMKDKINNTYHMGGAPERERLQRERSEMSQKHSWNIHQLLEKEPELAEDRPEYNTQSLFNAGDHGMDNYLAFLKKEIKTLHRIYRKNNCRSLPESQCKNMGVLRYQEGINTLQAYLDSLQKARQEGIDSNLKVRYWEKIHSTNAPSEEKDKIRKEYVIFMNMQVESRRIAKDIVLLEKLRDHFKFGNQGLYNLHYVEPEISEQLDKF